VYAAWYDFAQGEYSIWPAIQCSVLPIREPKIYPTPDQAALPALPEQTEIQSITPVLRRPLLARTRCGRMSCKKSRNDARVKYWLPAAPGFYPASAVRALIGSMNRALVVNLDKLT